MRSRVIEENTPMSTSGLFKHMHIYAYTHRNIPPTNVCEHECVSTDRMKFLYYTEIHYFIEGIRLGGLLFLGIHASLVQLTVNF